jgi:hypothetical protein
MGRFKLTGFLAWVLWCVAHIYFLIGFRNRLRGRHQLAVELRHVPARHPPDHRHVAARMEDCRCPEEKRSCAARPELAASHPPQLRAPAQRMISVTRSRRSA